MTVGVSSELTFVKLDELDLVQEMRSAHGVFTRLAPYKPLVIMAEVDALLNKPTDTKLEGGVVGMLQLDYEPIQGVHLIGTGETYRQPGSSLLLWGGWGSVDWFFLPHMDIRVDFVDQLEPVNNAKVNTFSIGPQYHLFL
jgi:hypothetical protein